MIHALLCNEAEARDGVTNETVLKIFEMGPPLGRSRESCDAVGGVNLTPDRQRMIKAFVDDRHSERDAERRRRRATNQEWSVGLEYRIHPAATRPSRDYTLWRFSCVGLVLESYRYARIVLLQPPFPTKTLAELKRIYPQHASRLDDPSVRTLLGIGTGDRWPVALVGYVMHSLARRDEEIVGAAATAYSPSLGDEYFPRSTIPGG